MVTKYILSDIPYNLSDIPLGSLVPRKSQPNQDAYIPLQDLKRPNDFNWRNHENFALAIDERRQDDWNAWFTQFFNTRLVLAAEAHERLWAKEGRIYELRQPLGLFNSICDEQSARQWLEQRYYSGESVYMVVGYQTFRDANAGQEDEQLVDVALQGTSPVGQMAAGGPPMDVGTLDVKMNARALRWRRTTQSFRIKGERIFAVCFRHVRYGWFAGGDVDNARLAARNCWVVSLRSKGKGASRVMEVTLGNEDEVDKVDNKPETSVSSLREVRLATWKEKGEHEVEFFL